jgi:hypothetical protein
MQHIHTCNLGYNGSDFDGFVGYCPSKDILLRFSSTPIHLQLGLNKHIPI